MLRYALRSLRVHAGRLVATATAVVVGIAFLAAGLMLTQAMKDALDGNVERQYAEVDVAVRPAGSIEGLGSLVAPAVLDQIRSTPGVAAADGEITGAARVLDRDGATVEPRAVGRAWISDQALNPLEVAEGRAPRDDREVALDVRSAADAGLRLGDGARIATPGGEVRLRLVGTTTFDGSDRLDDGGTVSLTPAAATDLLNGGTPGSADVLVRAEDGRAAEVRRTLDTSLPPTVDVLGGAEFRRIERAQASGFVDLLRPVLSGFAYLALFVAAFVIFNTFSVVVTQRYRELALVRAVEGTPGQVRRSLLTEGAVIGFVSSAVGLVAGALLALGVQAVLGLFDVELPGAGVAVSARTVITCLLVGTVVTIVSVAVPAFRAGRTKPVEAMRETAVDTSGTSRARAVIGGIALVASLVLLLADRAVGPRWYLLIPGALALFAGLVIGGPLLARAFALVVGPAMRRMGPTGRLAVDNAVRNPRRTATTANALVIGLFLVTLVTVSGDALKNWIVEQLNQLSSSDYLVAGEGGPIDPGLARSMEDVDGVAATATVRTSTVIDSSDRIVLISGADPDALRRTSGLRVVSGDLDQVIRGEGAAVVDLARLGGASTGGSAGPGEEREMASFAGSVGDRLLLLDRQGDVVEVPIVATLEPRIDTLFLGTLVSPGAFEQIAGERPITQVFVRAESGEVDRAGVGLERLVRDNAGVVVEPGNFIGAAVAEVFDFLIGAVNALLGMSVLIALIGVVNTLTLSIFERRHELGMVRALGMTRGQVATMVRMEAVLIGLLGTLVGVGSGLLLGWVVVGAMGEGEIALSVNWARVGLIALAGVAVGVVASLLPARRALKVDMLAATRAE